MGSPTGVEGMDDQKAPSGAVSAGWIQGFLTKVLANVSVDISHLSIVYREEDIAFSLHIDSLNVFSCDSRWDKSFCVFIVSWVYVAETCCRILQALGNFFERKFLCRISLPDWAVLLNVGFSLKVNKFCFALSHQMNR
jgi:hypothetical protein